MIDQVHVYVEQVEYSYEPRGDDGLDELVPPTIDYLRERKVSPMWQPLLCGLLAYYSNERTTAQSVAEVEGKQAASYEEYGESYAPGLAGSSSDPPPPTVIADASPAPITPEKASKKKSLGRRLSGAVSGLLSPRSPDALSGVLSPSMW